MSNQINDGGPAFPCVYYSEPIGSIGSQLTIKGGMTIRDYFAASALNGICNSRSHSDLKGHAIASARVAYDLADAMIKAREEK